MKLSDIGNLLERRNREMKQHIKQNDWKTDEKIKINHRKTASLNFPMQNNGVKYMRFQFDSESLGKSLRNQNIYIAPLSSSTNLRDALGKYYQPKTSVVRIPAFPKSPFGTHNNLNNSSLIFTELELHNLNEEKNEENIKLIKKVNGRNAKRRNSERDMTNSISFRYRIKSLQPQRNYSYGINTGSTEGNYWSELLW
ncbi:unnamed protein product [Blepharisma stoltei]|uniref:Uncharacterized protein n=1 Tax=Blepharisma stoltei TaxID=1481888 RepID=A0AAU9IXW1_9CILI|nr:unnamed protein product [Blepharisma stoltei]